MADAVFRERPAFGANVGNRPITAAPPVGVPVGPTGFPPPCPPEPPTTAIVSVTATELGGEYGLQITFADEVEGFEPFLGEPGKWVITGDGVPFSPSSVNPMFPNTLQEFLISGPVPPFVITVPPGSIRVWNAQGGRIVPGTFPVTVV